ncbi:MAG: hypothetical protein PUF48_00125 [Oscillospiraceae bacterium]|nr:hypothetical protein [Oscillospiraceae bacterium]
MLENTCCFIGHREINVTDELKEKLCVLIEHLITEESIDTFLFGSKSQFDDLCYDIVTEIKKKHPHIKRIFVRAEYPYIDESYKSYLLESYEDTYFPKSVLGAGKASYVKRNCEMIDNSRFCIVYYKKDYTPKGRKSGTKIALDYAEKKKKSIIRFPEVIK